jgi:hypothetical protein
MTESLEQLKLEIQKVPNNSVVIVQPKDKLTPDQIKGIAAGLQSMNQGLVSHKVTLVLFSNGFDFTVVPAGGTVDVAKA